VISKIQEVTVASLRNRKIAIFSVMTSFDKIWHGYVLRSSTPPQQIKFYAFKKFNMVANCYLEN